MKIPKLSAKRMGEWAEVCFTAAALHRGFSVAKPYGESEPYDVILCHKRTLHRVQVRSTSNFCDDRDRYCLATTRGVDRKRTYNPDEIDFLAALVVPYQVWYIFPVSFIADRRTLKLAPHRPTTSQTEQFREAWRLLR